MIRLAKIQNFRGLRDVQVPLGSLTVLVGANATGKSTVLRALNPSHALEPRDTWQHSSLLMMKIILEHANGTGVCRYESNTGLHSHTGWPSYSYQLLRLDLNHLREENQVVSTQQLAPTGLNLTNVFASLGRARQIEVGRELARLIPVISDVESRPSPNKVGFQTLYFQDRWNKEAWYDPREVSEGTMLILAYLTLQYQTPPVDLIAVEEPERGLHPYLLGELVSFLRRLSSGQIGPKPVQIVLATHSAEFLDHLRPEEVVFLTRSESDGTVKVSQPPTKEPTWTAAFKEYRESLGSAWLAGGLGGVPSSPQ